MFLTKGFTFSQTAVASTVLYNICRYRTRHSTNMTASTVVKPYSDEPGCTVQVDIFVVRKSVHHHTIQINQPTRCNSFTSLLLDVYVWFNTFRAPLRPSSGAYNCTRSLWFYRWSVVGRGLPDHDQQRSNRHAPAVKPEAPSAVVRS